VDLSSLLNATPIIVSLCVLWYAVRVDHRNALNNVRDRLATMTVDSYDLIMSCTAFKRVLHGYGDKALALPAKTLADIDRIQGEARHYRSEAQKLSKNLGLEDIEKIHAWQCQIMELKIQVKFHEDRESFKRENLSDACIEELIGHGGDVFVDPTDPDFSTNQERG
jgi:hypothetical protein